MKGGGKFFGEVDYSSMEDDGEFLEKVNCSSVKGYRFGFVIFWKSMGSFCKIPREGESFGGLCLEFDRCVLVNRKVDS